jgi:hypothetical protein
MAVSEQKRVQKKIGRIEATIRSDATALRKDNAIAGSFGRPRRLAARSAFTDYFLSRSNERHEGSAGASSAFHCRIVTNRDTSFAGASRQTKRFD